DVVLASCDYTLLNNKGALIVIGAMLCLSVPLRRALKNRNVVLSSRGLALSSVGYGVGVGGTAGSGVILLSRLMAAGVTSAGVIASDAIISIAIGIIKISVFGLRGVINAQEAAFALLICVVALPRAFLSRAFVERMPMHVHAAILDVVVIVGGVFMIFTALA